MIFIGNDTTVLDSNNKKKQLDRLITQANSYFGEELPIIHPPKSTTYMGIALANTALAYVITKEKKYLDETERRISIVNGYEQWGNAHLVNVDLSASWILFGLSLSYDWLKNDLSKDLKNQTQKKLALQAGIMYDYRKKTFGKGWATQYFQNHNWINMTGLAAAGLALVKDSEFQKEAQNWIDDSVANFDSVFSLLSEDGSDYEGTVYWRYGASWLFIAAHLLKNAQIRNYFNTCDFLRNTFYYRLSQAVPNLAQTANYGDCHDTFSSHCAAVYYKTASEYNDGYAQFLGNYVVDNLLESEAQNSKVKPGIKPESYLEYIWFNPSIQEQNINTLSPSFYFDDLGLVSLRSSWKKDAFYFSFKSSYPGGKKQWKNLWQLLQEQHIDAFGLSHQHPDANSFILHAKGEYLTIDEGYNRSMRASDHSVMLVDNIGYPVENVNDVLTKSAFKIKELGLDPKKYVPNFKYFKDYGHIQLFSSDVAALYDPSLCLTQNERICIVIHSKIIIMLDNMNSTHTHTYTWQIHTPKEIFGISEQNNNGYNTYKCTNNNSFFDLVSCNKDVFVSKRINYVKAIMTTQEPDNYCETTSHVFALSNTKKKNACYFRNIFCVNTLAKDIIQECKNTHDDCMISFTVDSVPYILQTHKNTYTLTENNKKIYTNAHYFNKENI